MGKRPNILLLLTDRSLIMRCRNIYERGFYPYRSSFGWAKENIKNATLEGECCTTADLAQGALQLALAGYTEYFAEVERIARNHLIATQLFSPLRLADGHGRSRDEIETIKRTYGSISGWGFPNDFAGRMGRKEVQLCCSHQAAQAIFDIINGIATEKNGEIRINLFFSSDNNLCGIKSELPFEGRISVRMKCSSVFLIRSPENVPPGDVDVVVNKKRLVEKQLYSNYIVAGPVKKGSKIVMRFPLLRRREKERILNREFVCSWLGQTLAGISPEGRYGVIYSNRRRVR